MSLSISWRLLDITAKGDSSLLASDKQPFVDINDLKRDDLAPTIAATWEEDFFPMDGSMPLFPDEPEGLPWGWWSRSMSDLNGVFAAPPELTITFTENHTSVGLTFDFYSPTDDYCSEIRIRWYDAADGLLADKTFYPDRPRYVAYHLVENYRKIVVTFLRTAKPYRYVKLTGILYGAIKEFTDADIEEATLKEAVNPLSAELPYSELMVRVFSEDEDFAITNPKGIYAALQQRQPLLVKAEGRELGTYYLNEWSSTAEISTTLTATDLLGVIDKTDFLGGMYSNVPAGDIVAEIMASAGAEYEMDAALASVPLSGWIPVCTHREALQQVAFALGAIVTCGRTDRIHIQAPTASVAAHISYDRKTYEEKLTLRPLVTGVEVTTHSYKPETQEKELYSAELSPGRYDILFSEPVHGITVTGATLVSTGANHAVIDVSVAGTVNIVGKGYIDNTQLFGVYAASLPAGEKRNVLQIKDATLISPANAKAAAQRVYDYYQQRYENELEIVTAEGEQPGQLVTVDSMYGRVIKGRIEWLRLDLATMIATCGVVGVVE